MFKTLIIVCVSGIVIIEAIALAKGTNGATLNIALTLISGIAGYSLKYLDKRQKCRHYEICPFKNI